MARIGSQWLFSGWCLWIWSCGAADSNEPKVDIYNGTFSVVESFFSDSGTQCPQPPLQSIQNQVTIKIDKNKAEAIFQALWSVLKGEINSKGSFFLVGNLGSVEERFEFSGTFETVDFFSGWMKQIKTTCTRTFQLLGERIPGT